jgi:hypothetical protein
VILWLLLSVVAAAQSPFAPPPSEAVEVAQVSFLIAESVETAADGERVAIIAENLDAKREYGVVLKLTESAKWVEVHPVDKPFPPAVVKPYVGSRFLIRGKPGERFYVSIRGDGVPQWVEVVVAPTVDAPPVDPAPEDPAPGPAPSDLRELSKSLSAKLNDPATASMLKVNLLAKVEALESLCKAGRCPTLDSAKSEIRNTIDAALLLRKSPSKDWLGTWRKPISDAIGLKGYSSTQAYVAAMRQVAEGL